MRMDRYEDEQVKEKTTRTNKNQELYTDVYLNNAYVDLSDLKEVMNEDEEVKEEKTKKKEEYVPYTYEEKNYDIVSIVEEAIKKNSDNKIKRTVDNEDVDNIIESINEIQREKAADDTLLSDLMPDRDTEVMPPLENPILDTSLLDTSMLHKDEMSNDLADIEKEEEKTEEKKEIVKDTKEIDDSFANEIPSSKKKIIFIIVGVVLLIGIIIGILIWKKVIKF